MIVDSHCHLDMLVESGRSIEDIISHASDLGVKYMQTICTRIDNFNNILAIAKKHPNIFTSVGVHPSEVNSENIVSVQELLDLSNEPKVIGLGETGLDYYYNKEEHKLSQIRSFENHILASKENQLPIIIHTRSAEEDTASLVIEHIKHATFPGLIHCFTASETFAKKMLDHGLFISISGIVTFKNASSLQDIVKFIPLDRLLVETDSPYLAPVPRRGAVNEPAFTKYVVQYIAELKGVSVEEVANATTQNFFTLFRKARHNNNETGDLLIN